MSSSASPYSVLSVLTPAELADPSSWANISFHRPGKSNRATLPPQRVPRHIMQTGFTWSHAFSRHPDYLKSWTDLNPEYEYSFFGDVHAHRFIDKHGTAKEAAAFRRILTGAQRADLFRVVWLKVAGGVYADLDEELRTPMRKLIGGTDANGGRVPRMASAVIGTFWPFEFLVYAPEHPVMIETARIMADGILLQVRTPCAALAYTPPTSRHAPTSADRATSGRLVCCVLVLLPPAGGVAAQPIKARVQDAARVHHSCHRPARLHIRRRLGHTCGGRRMPQPHPYAARRRVRGIVSGGFAHNVPVRKGRGDDLELVELRLCAPLGLSKLDQAARVPDEALCAHARVLRPVAHGGRRRVGAVRRDGRGCWQRVSESPV